MATTPAEIRQQFVDWNTALYSKQPEAAYAIVDVIRRGFEANPGGIIFTNSVDGLVVEWHGGEIACATPDAFNGMIDAMAERGVEFPWSMTTAHGHDRQGERCIYITRITGDWLEELWDTPAVGGER